jgi:subtilisin family serine protease
MLIALAAVMVPQLEGAHAQNPEDTSSYIVVLRAGTVPDSFARAESLTLKRVYRSALNGGVLELTEGEARRLRTDTRVRGLTPVRELHALDIRLPATGVFTPGLPTGIDRIDAEFAPINETVGVAILDSGIDVGRPEFNLQAALSFVSGSPTGQDDVGHGTHIAGIAAASVMSSGFRGVSPRAPLWSMKVLDSSGTGQDADVVAAIDWLTANGPGLGIRVANMSFGAPAIISSACGLVGSTVVDPLHFAICQSVQQGIIYVAAAGNGGNAGGLVPALYPEVVAVSNVRDNDGRGGALTPPSDDTFYPTSSYGSVVDLAAPGTAILSTVPTGACLVCHPSGYRLLTGSSMAAPHVAGAIADYIQLHPGVSVVGAPQQLAQAALDVIGGGQSQSGVCGFTGDPDAFPEPMVYVGIPASDCGAAPTPDGDGDELPDGVETGVYGSNPNSTDTDGDGCGDGREVGANQLAGGRRDPVSAFDFFDVPAPAGPGIGTDGRPILAAGAARNGSITLQDTSIVLAYAGRSSANPSYAADNNGDGVADGQQLDRTASRLPGLPWRSGPPSGAVTLADVSIVLAHVGMSCL